MLRARTTFSAPTINSVSPVRHILKDRVPLITLNDREEPSRYVLVTNCPTDPHVVGSIQPISGIDSMQRMRVGGYIVHGAPLCTRLKSPARDAPVLALDTEQPTWGLAETRVSEDNAVRVTNAWTDDGPVPDFDSHVWVEAINIPTELRPLESDSEEQKNLARVARSLHYRKTRALFYLAAAQHNHGLDGDLEDVLDEAQINMPDYSRLITWQATVFVATSSGHLPVDGHGGAVRTKQQYDGTAYTIEGDTIVRGREWEELPRRVIENAAKAHTGSDNLTFLDHGRIGRVHAAYINN